MLIYNLRIIFKERGIERPFSFLVKAGIAPATAHNIMYNNTRTFKLRHIELLCRILMCEPNDLLTWLPEKGEIYPDDLPLRKLQRQNHEGQEWMEIISKMPLDKLREVAKTVVEKEKED